MKSFIYLAKEPEPSVYKDIEGLSKYGEVLVVACNPGYIDYYEKKGYNVITSDLFFKLEDMKFTMCLANPPYGSGGNLAIKFLNKLGDLTDDIRIIMPLSVRKPSSQNKIRLDMICVEDEQLPDDTFPGSIRAVSQRWVKSDTPREKIETITSHDDFQFLHYDLRFDADCMIGRMGGGPAGRVKTENFTHYADTHYFIKTQSQQVTSNLVAIADELREIAIRDTNGRASLSKNDLISIYNKHFG